VWISNGKKKISVTSDDRNVFYKFSAFFYYFSRWLSSFETVCSAELLGIKVLVPCDPIDYLNNEYGSFDKWIIPISKDYKWSNLDTNYSLWSDSHWPYAIKFFSTNGKLNNAGTLNFINKNSNLNLSNLPVDVMKLYQ
jgi:hypothetical protein